jgi:hypothetical protein
MKSRSRGAVIAVAATLLAAAPMGGFLAAAGAASAPGSFQLKAQGDALTIALAGTTLTGGDSTITADDITPNADAAGSGQLLPTVAGSQHAVVTVPGQSQNLSQTCASPTIPAPLSTYLSAGLGCGSAQAALDSGGLPSAGSSGSVASLNVGAGGLLSQIVTASSPVATALTGLFGPLPTVPGTPTLGALLNGLGASVASTTGLATLSAGTSTGSVSASATSATATNTSSGGTIDLLPGAGGPGLPAVSITVGSAKTTATLDRTGGAGTATADPAVVTVTVNNPVTGSNTVTVAPGQSQALLAGTPLASTISVGSSTVNQGAGAASATANGVTLDLLTGLPGGGVLIDLASSTASVTGVALAAAVTPPAAAPPAAAPAGAPIAGVTAVHTGEPWGGSLPLVVVALVAGLGLIYRRRLGALIPVLVHGTRSIGTPLGAVAVRVRSRLRHFAGLVRGGPGR